MGRGGSGGRGERRRGAPSHGARLGHLLLELADGALQLFPGLPLPAQLLLQLLSVGLRLLQPLTQLRQLGGGTEEDVRSTRVCSESEATAATQPLVSTCTRGQLVQKRSNQKKNVVSCSYPIGESKETCATDRIWSI